MPIPGDVARICADRLGEDARAAVGQVVAGDAGDDDVLQAERADRLGDASRLVVIEPGRAAGLDRAEPAGPGAGVAEDHDRGGALVPALPDVRAVGLLADRVERQPAKQSLEIVVGLARRQPRPDPVGVAPERHRTVGGRLADEAAAHRDRRKLRRVVRVRSRRASNIGSSRAIVEVYDRRRGRGQPRPKASTRPGSAGARPIPELGVGLGVRRPVGHAIGGRSVSARFGPADPSRAGSRRQRNRDAQQRGRHAEPRRTPAGRPRRDPHGVAQGACTRRSGGTTRRGGPRSSAATMPAARSSTWTAEIPRSPRTMDRAEPSKADLSCAPIAEWSPGAVGRAGHRDDHRRPSAIRASAIRVREAPSSRRSSSGNPSRGSRR